MAVSLAFPFLSRGLLSPDEHARALAACFAPPSFRICSRFPSRLFFHFLDSPARWSAQSKPGLSNAAEVRANPCQDAADRTLEVRDGAQTIGFRPPDDAAEAFGKAGKHLGHIGSPLLGLSLQVMDQSLARASQNQNVIPQSRQILG
jgi:hypothetical protein